MGKWTTKAEQPVALYGSALGVIDGKIHIVGGWTGSTASTTHRQYDPATDAWMSKAAMPLGRRYAGAAVVNGKLYVVGGLVPNDPTDSLIVYDPATNMWTNLQSAPTVMYGMSVVAVNNRIYVLGGFTGSARNVSSACYEYNPSTNTWTTKASMPTARAHAGAAVVNGMIYVIGGTSNGSDSVATNAVYVPGSNSWTTLTAMPTARLGLTCVSLGQKIYAIGGFSTATSSVGRKENQAYDTQTGTWSSEDPMPTARGYTVSASVGSVLYVLGGLASASSPVSGLTTNEMYSPNAAPTITITSPTDNQTLTEGSTYQISGSATDADSGNVVTVKYKIDDGTTYNVTASVSDGTTPLNFSKTLTYLNSRLYDGATPVTPILDDSVTHKLTVWAEDDKGGKSADAVRNFTVLYNQPPQISGSDQDLGSISAPPSINYTVTDIEHYSFTITEKVGDTIIRSFAGTDGKQETLTIPDDIWITLQPDVTHNLTITATDQYGASSTRTYTFKRTVDGIELETRIPLPADAQPYRMVLTLNAQYPQNAVVNVQVCNNGYDENPTWEDATSAVLNGRPYVFTNTTKTALDWGIRIKISILPGA